MKGIFQKLPLLLMAKALLFVPIVHGADNQGKANTNAAEKQQVTITENKTVQATSSINKIPTYIPPFRGAPRNRMGGGTRSHKQVHITALSPEHTGLTISDQPTLYFSKSEPVDSPMEFTLVAHNAEEPLIETRFEPDDNPIQAVSLSDLGVKLSVNTDYYWYVTIVVNPQLRSQDIVTGGSIKYTPPSADLTRAISRADSNEKTGILAQNGIWYDAIDAASQNAPSSTQFTSLLEQVGLKLE